MPFTPEQLLTFAARKGDATLVRERVEAGADPLHGAALLESARLGHLEVIETLVELGADVNVQDERGFGALEYALRWGREDAARLLLERGAKLSHHSRPHWQEQVARLLKQD